ncbi:hypothetical protein [Streptosporangium sp. NPDC023615]|uniref:hypothetical protein n=1 Tax=Streptosporangium sp. NPDC023615 TaxID=3154794 RepID=UPI003419D89A
MLKSRTRRRIAVKTAVVATVGAGIFGAFPALASIYAVPKPVTYTCDPMGTAGGAAISVVFQMDLTGPTEAVTGSPLAATWKIGPPAGATFVAPVPVPATDRLVIEADLQINSVPTAVPAVPSAVTAVTATAPAAVITVGQVVTPPPLAVTVTPSATGVVAFQPAGFDLILRPATGAGTTPDPELFSCEVTDLAQATAAALKVTVKTTLGTTASPSASTSPSPSASVSPSPSASVSPSPSASPSRSARVTPTVTVKVTRTAEEQIEETPEGAASTGGGGDAGPDARMIMFTGALMVALAGAGGLVLRRRTTGRG